MKTRTRIIAAVLAAGCALPLMTSCGKRDNGYDAKTDTWTFTVWSGDSHSKSTMEKLVNEYNAGEGKQKGIQIEYKVQSDSESLKLAIESDTAPDLFSNVISEDAEKGRIIAIEDMPGGKEFLKKYEGKLVENLHTYQGKTYKVPYYVTTFGLVYNKDMFKKYGIVDENGEAKPPKTYDEMREYAKILTHPENQEYGIMLPLKNEWFALTDIQVASSANQGFVEFNPEKGCFDYTGYQPIIDMYLGIKADGSYYPDPEGIDNDPGRAQFAEGNVGMKLGASYDVGVYNDQFPAKCDWGVAPYPTADEKVVYPTDMTNNGYLCINKKSAETKDAEKLFEVFKWIHGDEVLRALYEEGKAIPYDNKIVEDVVLDENSPHGWKEFAALVATSQNRCKAPGSITDGKKSFTQVFNEDIWPEKVPAKDALAEITKYTQEGMDQWFSEHPDKKLEDYIVPGALKTIQ